LPQLIHDGVPDLESILPGRVGEEDAAVAGVDRAAIALLGARRAEGGWWGRSGRLGSVPVLVFATGKGEEAEHRGRAVALGEPAAEAGGGDDAAPLLAHGGGAQAARGVVRRQVERISSTISSVARTRREGFGGESHVRELEMAVAGPAGWTWTRDSWAISLHSS